MHSKVLASMENNPWFIRQDRVALKYGSWCLQQRLQVFPITYTTLSGFLSYCMVKNGSTKSISNLISAIKNFALRNQIAWLNDSDCYKIKRYVAYVEYQDAAVTRRAKAATMDKILEVVAVLDSSKVDQEVFILAMALCYHGLLRAGELFTGVKVKDIEWNFRQRYLIFPLRRTKTHRRGDPINIIIKDHTGFSAYQLLINWMDKHGLWSKSEAYILPKVNGRNDMVDFTAQYTISKFRYQLKKYFIIHEQSVSKYTGHSFRAGAATDLFSAGVSIQDVQKIGRWKSMCVLIYYRAESIQVAHKAAQAFALSFQDYELERRRRGNGVSGALHS